MAAVAGSMDVKKRVDNLYSVMQSIEVGSAVDRA